MTTATAEKPSEHHSFEADVSRLLHMMVHSVYSDKDVFLRELISNAADACEKLRYEATTTPGLAAGEGEARIALTLDEEGRRLTVEDNGIGMSRAELIDALGTIARSGTRAFMERLQAGKPARDASSDEEKESEGGKAEGDSAQLIGQFGVGFYSCFMVASHVDVVSRRAGTDEAWIWSSDGKGSFDIRAADLAEAPARGTRITLHLMDEAKTYASRFTVERIVKAQSGHVPVPIDLIEKPDAEPARLTDGTALWTKARSEITDEQYNDFYRGLSGQYDTPALTVHFRAEGRVEYTALAFVPTVAPFDLFDPDRRGRMKLYVKRVFITDDADVLPRYLRFVRGLVDTADLPLNVSREMIQESPVLQVIKKGVTNRVLSALEKQLANDRNAYETVWSAFGSVIKEGIYEDFERREQLLALSLFKTTASGDGLRTLDDYVRDAKDGQDAIYYISGGNLDQIKASPQLEGFRARGIEVLLLTDSVDSFWAMNAPKFKDKAFRSITQGGADLKRFPLPDAGEKKDEAEEAPKADAFLALARSLLAEEVSDVRASDRLTESAVCLVAPEDGYDRQLEKILQDAGRLQGATKPILEVNPDHPLIAMLARIGEEKASLREDAARLLLDQARVLDGDKPADPRAFADRLSRLLERALSA
ncbi:molecular chaperone HtpG [Xaviernesmea oryzae]|uniref:Chaperone protein HtpG n=1 Tax=Xaviernesmea oryzae TaxID=464029 RepID=A0A1Q9B3T6_9HYPH|nr:molecular chaperone HtpG [Xaviernesmea oryzae]OLP62722.1 molecular chaperone HtpG [Xaviernesmea oryzae]SEM38119.1 molecular chaperone HtpG [Xaviernesmea oryzae]